MTEYALITGASAGLGAEFAHQLAAKGLNLVLVARREDTLSKLAEHLKAKYQIEIHTLSCDLSKPEAPVHIFDHCQTLNLKISWLINNAGGAGHDLIADRNWADHEAFFQLMMTSIAHLCHLFIPDMVAAKKGHVINIASVAGRIARAGGCNYGPTKTYVVALSEELALTYASSGVKVCALCPGYTHTDFHETAGLMEMKHKTPSWLWYSAETVVREGIDAVQKGKSVYVSGRLYRLVDPILQSVWTRRFFKTPARI